MTRTTAAVVLAGGGSTRMGTPKATLEWHGSTLLRRAVGIVARAVDGPVVVVRAHGQDLPELPDDVEIAEDARHGRGPLQGMAAGFGAIDGRVPVVYVTGVDQPLLHPAFVRYVLRALGDEDDVALPRAHGFPHPLAAAYRTATVVPLLDELLAKGVLATRAMIERCRVRTLDERQLRADPVLAAADPALDSLLNVNEPDEYESARARPAPQVIVLREGREPIVIRAATLAAAAAHAAPDATAEIEGRRAVDPHEPLAHRDTVSFTTPAA